MNTETIDPTYHVLLVGIDRYPAGYNSLSGCVNDIDAIEGLLLDPPGIGIPVEQIHIMRLAAPRAGRLATSRFQTESLAPTKANLVNALKTLAGPTVTPSDRVLIYYSGHGDQKRWDVSRVWHEALVPHNGAFIEYLFDIEIIGLINAIAARTSDLTVVLDCCHSAGVTRDLTGGATQGATRLLMPDRPDATPIVPPDLGALDLADGAGERDVAAHLLYSANPDYLVVVACESDETAKEGAYLPGQPWHGAFTQSLLNVLADKDAAQRTAVRWADIWPGLLAKTAEHNAELNQFPQHPWLIGRSERKVFGGWWQKMDAGYRVTSRVDGDYDIAAGSLMGVTEGAEIAVYGDEPLLFAAIGSATDRPIGRLRVNRSGPSSAVASAIGSVSVVPEGILRGRLVKPGANRHLRVSLKPEDAGLRAHLEASGLLQVVSPADSLADVEVVALPGGGWRIGNDTEAILALVPTNELQALRVGLEHYHSYNTVLNMARACNDPLLSNCLSVRFLDCNNEAALAAMSNKEKSDPDLPEAPRDADRIYAVPAGFKWCLKVSNTSNRSLKVTLLACTSGGKVEYLNDGKLRPGAALVMWRDRTEYLPFEAWPDELTVENKSVSLPAFATDRLIVIGTTNPAHDLHYLQVYQTVQEVINENLERCGAKGQCGPTNPIEPVELWTSIVTPMRIQR